MKRKSESQSEGSVCQRLLLQPLCRRKYQRQLRKIHTDCFCQLRCHDLKTADGKAGTEVQYRRDSQLFTDSPQLRSGVFCSFRRHQTAVFNSS